jgi:hypothetical protein
MRVNSREFDDPKRRHDQHEDLDQAKHYHVRDNGHRLEAASIAGFNGIPGVKPLLDTSGLFSQSFLASVEGRETHENQLESIYAGMVLRCVRSNFKPRERRRRPSRVGEARVPIALKGARE